MFGMVPNTPLSTALFNPFVHNAPFLYPLKISAVSRG